MELRLIQTFTAQDDGGNSVMLHVYQNFTDSGMTYGSKKILTADGESVNRLKDAQGQWQKGRYQTAASKRNLRSDALDAP